MFASLCSLAAVIALGEARADSRDVYYTGELGSEKPLKWKRTVQHAKRRGSTLGMDDEAVATRHYTVSFARSATPASKKDLQDALAEAGVGADVKFVPNRSYRVYCSLMQLHVATEKKGWVVDAVRLLQDRHKLDMERLESDERMSRVARYLVHTSHDPEKRLFETGRFREGDDRYEEELIKEWKAILQLRGLKAAVSQWEKVGPTRYLMVLGSTSEIEERRNVLRAVASSHSVAWMEAAPEYKVLNDVATSLVQSDQQGAHPLWENSFGRLTGANQLAMIGDTGLRLDSCFFRDQTRGIAFWPKTDPEHRKIFSYNQCINTDNGNVDSNDALGHGSHVAGSLAGLPENQFQQYKGLVPDAKIFFYDLQCDGQPGLILPYDLRVYFETGITIGAGVSHNSWGNSEKPAQVITMDAEADSILFENSAFIIVFAAGNDANVGVLSPAASKNVVAVGAHMNNYREAVRQNVASFSARGPTFDNRIKPEIMAPGEMVTSAHNGKTCGITDKKGTSMAAPFVSGSALLLKQYLEEGWYPSGRRDNPSLYPANSLIKAMLIHSTRRLRGTQSGLFVGKDIPNKYQGWGSVALQDIVYFAEKVGTEEELTFAKTHVHLVNNHSIGQDEVFVIDFHADEPSRETRAAGVRATLVWTDPPASEGSMKALVNDLDLSLMLPNGSVLNSGRQNSYDRLNVVEQIDLPSAAPGWYRAYVYGYHVVETHPYPKLPFSVVITAPSIDVSSDPSKKPQCPGSPVCGGQRGKCNSQGLCECAPEFHHIDCGLCDAEVNCNNHGTCTP
ncbi:Serine protease/ABC transporter B family protein tagB, partial [Diplonema papillatum]